MVVRLTARARALFGHRLPRPVAVPPGEDDWYGNVVPGGRRRLLLLMHTGTMFSVVVPGIRPSHGSEVGEVVAGAVAEALAWEGLSPDTLGPLDPAHVTVAATASRHVLGLMVDNASVVENAVEAAGRIDALDVRGLTMDLQRTLHTRERRTLTALDLVDERLGRPGRQGPGRPSPFTNP